MCSSTQVICSVLHLDLLIPVSYWFLHLTLASLLLYHYVLVLVGKAGYYSADYLISYPCGGTWYHFFIAFIEQVLRKPPSVSKICSACFFYYLICYPSDVFVDDVLLASLACHLDLPILVSLLISVWVRWSSLRVSALPNSRVSLVSRGNQSTPVTIIKGSI